MLDNKKIREFSEFIKDNFSEKSNELADALDLVNLVFDDIYDLIKKDIDKYYDAQNLDKIKNLISKSQDTLNIKNEILNYKEMLIDEYEEENLIIEELQDEEDEKKSNPNYSDYYVDSFIPHTLYENFTYTKACGFEFKGIKYESKNMRDVLVSLCQILANEDKDKMIGFVDDPTMRGRKVKYFDNKLIVEDNINKNEKIEGLDVYVWVNSSCNQIRNVIRRILKKYNYKFDDFKIYLRADYTDLHRKPNNDTEENKSNSDGIEKIGKHVQSCFRQLENYHFTSNELLAMQSESWTKKIFDISIPLIKKYDNTKSISEQIKINGHNRYWKTPYRLSGTDYFVVSQWYEYNREKFDNWFKLLNI